jgi:hypothetical protein
LNKRVGIVAFEPSRQDKGTGGLSGRGSAEKSNSPSTAPKIQFEVKLAILGTGLREISGNRLICEDTAAIREHACPSKSVGDLQKAANSRLLHEG